MNLTEQVLIREVKEGTPSTGRPPNEHWSESLTIRWGWTFRIMHRSSMFIKGDMKIHYRKKSTAFPGNGRSHSASLQPVMHRKQQIQQLRDASTLKKFSKASNYLCLQLKFCGFIASSSGQLKKLTSSGQGSMQRGESCYYIKPQNDIALVRQLETVEQALSDVGALAPGLRWVSQMVVERGCGNEAASLRTALVVCIRGT